MLKWSHELRLSHLLIEVALDENQIRLRSVEADMRPLNFGICNP